MTTSLFITGASGFIGTSFLEKLDPRKYKSVFCLSRSHSPIMTDLAKNPNFSWIKGGLFDTNLYQGALAASDTVVHLAAATGKATPAQCFEVNAKGTEVFVAQCERARIKNFLLVSTIAVKFQRAARYYYAQTKKLSEETVKKSRLAYAIVRPTIVLGKDSAAWAGLSKLALAPVTPVFGDGANAIQPVYVDDVGDALKTVLDEGLFQNETFDLGGPEVITMENFLRRIHHAHRGKDPKIVHIPAAPLIPILAVLEKFFYTLLPLNAGQLSPFRNDGTADPNALSKRQLPGMKNVDQMLKLIMDNG